MNRNSIIKPEDIFNDNANLVELARKTGEHNCKKVKVHQLRKILEIFIKIKSKYNDTLLSTNDNEKATKELINELHLSKIKLAYARGRQKDLENLYQIVTPQIEHVIKNKKYEHFEKLYTFYEGVVSYHKYYGGK